MATSRRFLRIACVCALLFLVQSSCFSAAFLSGSHTRLRKDDVLSTAFLKDAGLLPRSSTKFPHIGGPEDVIRGGSTQFTENPQNFSYSMKKGGFRGRNVSEGETLLRSSKAASPTPDFDYDVIVVGCGVGGHQAALHATARGLKTAILTGADAGGTCVNRGCVPSKALLASSRRVREFLDRKHLKTMGLNIPDEAYAGFKVDRQVIADHAGNLVKKVRGGLVSSLKGHGVDIFEEYGQLIAPQEILLSESWDGSSSSGKPSKRLKARDIILAPGSLPIVPRGIQVDEETVFTSDGGLKLKRIPSWLAIVGSGYIGMEFADVFTALGSEVTIIEALPTLMSGFDDDVAKAAEKLLVAPRPIDYRVGVFASEVTPGIPGEKPVKLKLIDAKTKEFVEEIHVDACMVATGRYPNTKSLGVGSLGIQLTKQGFVPCDDRMRVLTSSPADGKAGEVVPHLYCVGDANGKMMLAHAASAQAVSAIENIIGNAHAVNHDAIPAACFTQPEIAFVGLTEAKAKEKANNEGFKLKKAMSYFKANSKALAEGESDGFVKLLYREDDGRIIGAHIIGLHASDLIQEVSNAIAGNQTVYDLSMMVHTHPTLSEVMEGAFKTAAGMHAH